MISTAAEGSLKTAAAILRPHEDEDAQIGDAIGRLLALADGAAGQRAAERLQSTAAKQPNTPPHAKPVTDELRKAQADYLRDVSPNAAAAWEAGHTA